jgi:parvulin-like peptidyl-prolyl isomerase
MIQRRSGQLPQILIVALAVLLCGRTVCGEVGLVDGVVAVVNDRNILYSDVARNAVMEYRRLAQKYGGQEFQAKADEVYRKTLAALIERHIVLSAVENPNPEAIDLMVEKQLDEVVRISFKGDGSAFLEALAVEHLSMQEWKNEVRDNILISMFKRNEVDSRVLLSPGAVRREYDAGGDKYKTTAAVQLRIIAIRRGESDADMALGRQRADEVRKQAADGKDFVSLQKSSLEDPGPEGRVGEPEWVGSGDLRPEVALLWKPVTPSSYSRLRPVAVRRRSLSKR